MKFDFVGIAVQFVLVKFFLKKLVKGLILLAFDIMLDTNGD